MRVRATNEDVRKLMKHPLTGMRFRSDIGQTVEWPDDAFTRRRIRDGDIEVVEEAGLAADKQKAQQEQVTRRAYRREQVTGESSS